MDWDSEKSTVGDVVLGPSTDGHDVDRKVLGHIATSWIREMYLVAYSAAIVPANKSQLHTFTISAVAKKYRWLPAKAHKRIRIKATREKKALKTPAKAIIQ